MADAYAIYAGPKKPLAFIVLLLVLNEMVLVVEGSNRTLGRRVRVRLRVPRC